MLDLLDYQARKTPQALSQSLHETGFAVLSNTPIDLALMRCVYQDWQRFFTSEEKHYYTFDPQVQSGYFPFQLEQAKGHSVPDLKEFFHLYRGVPLPEGIGHQTWQLFEQLNQLAAELLSWVEAFSPPHVSFTEPLHNMIAGSQETLLRLIHYPPLDDELPPGATRAAAHEDINLITLLPAATTTGLELLDRQGQWISVPCQTGDIVVNSGDMLQMASQGYYRSATHRVINPEGEMAKSSRFSMPLFLHPRRDVILSGETTARAYLLERLAEIGLLCETRE